MGPSSDSRASFVLDLVQAMSHGDASASVHGSGDTSHETSPTFFRRCAETWSLRAMTTSASVTADGLCYLLARPGLLITRRRFTVRSGRGGRSGWHPHEVN